MKYAAAVLLALAIVAAQCFRGGALVPALALPAYGFCVLAALACLIPTLRNPAPPGFVSLAAVTAFFGYFIWRCLEAGDAGFARLDLGAALACGVMFFAVACGLPDSRSRLLFLAVVGAAALVQVVIGILQFARHQDALQFAWWAEELRIFYLGRFPNRARGLFVNPNQFAWLMTPGALFCLALALWGRVRMFTRILLAYFALVFLAGAVLSASRGGLISLLCGFAALSAVSLVGGIAILRRGRPMLVLGGALLFGLCIGAGYWLYTGTWAAQARLDMILLPDVRSQFLEHAWRLFQTSPAFGAGPGAFIYAARLYRTGGLSQDAIFAHDDWIQFLAEYGFVGFALALAAVALLLSAGLVRFLESLAALSKMRESPLSNSSALLIAALSTGFAFGLHSLVDFNLHIPANALLAGAVAGLLCGGALRGMERPGRWLSWAGRVWGAVVLVALAAGLTIYLLKFAKSDYHALMARNALAKANVEAAISETEAGLEHQPADPWLHATRGEALSSYESALFLEAADSMLVIDEDEGELPGADSVQQEDHLLPEIDSETLKTYRRLALEAFEKAAELQPGERLHQIRLAGALESADRQDDAFAHYLEAIRLDPAHGFAYRSYGDALLQAGKLEDAEAIYIVGSRLPGGELCGVALEILREEREMDEEEPLNP